ncbi:MAG: glycosyltransferase [Chloroflexi bacterium]|nr:MAG: glycosyltransferase [Chloroflexota bacterium]
MIVLALSLLTTASFVYWVVAWWCTRSFWREPVPASDFTPPVSILKPVHGIDTGAYQNFASFADQDYPVFEVLIGLLDAEDPVHGIIERVQYDFEHVPIRIIHAEPIGTNNKVSILASLAEEARHDILLISDSDMRVTPDYLRQVVAPLEDRSVGLVTCLYRAEDLRTLTARLEALYLATTYMPSVLVGHRYLKLSFALGATMVLRREDLARIGGFPAIADYLADDYQLGKRVGDLGKQVRFAKYMPRDILGATTFREQWDREVRWAKCARVSRPLEYPWYFISFNTPLASLTALAMGLTEKGWLLITASVLFRWLVGWSVTGYSGDRVARRWLFLLPLRDFLTALVWVAALAGRHVVWGGRKFWLTRDGALRPVVDEVLPGRTLSSN